MMQAGLRFILFLSMVGWLGDARFCFSQEQLTITVTSPKTQRPEIAYEHLEPGKLKVVVTDSGVPVGGLSANDFTVRSPLSRYEILNLSPLLQTEVAKVSIILCIDNSQSMLENLGVLKSTLEELLDSFGPSVKVGTVFFDMDFPGSTAPGREALPNIRAYELTRDHGEVRKRFAQHLRATRLTDKTYLLDGIYTGIRVAEQAAAANDSRYVIVLSDGMDNASRKNKDEIRSLAAKNPGLVFYTIDFLTQDNPFLVELAQSSGGGHSRAKKAEELSAIFRQISQDLVTLSGYLVSYRVPLAVLAGRVQAKDRCAPLPNAQLICAPLNSMSGQQTVRVNERGFYQTKAALPHRWRLTASAPDYLADSVEVEIANEEVYFADFELRPNLIAVQGRVTDAGTSPLAEAQVTITALESGATLLESFTDSLGTYRVMASPSSRLLITATKPGYTFGTLQVDSLSAETPLADIVLGLTAEGVVSEFRFLFEFNSDKLNLTDVATRTQLQGCLAFVQRELEKSPERAVRLVGWTDNVGAADYNQNLSQRRARYVRDYLVKQGVPAERIFAEGRGISTKYDNADEAARALNRRTDVVFFDQQKDARAAK